MAWAAPEGKASFLFVTGSEPSAPLSLEETAAVFARWQFDTAPCFSKLGDAAYHLGRHQEYQGTQWQTAFSLGSAVCSLLKHAGRLAELCECLETLVTALRAKDKPFQAARLAWEKSWILEEWGYAPSRHPVWNRPPPRCN